MQLRIQEQQSYTIGGQGKGRDETMALVGAHRGEGELLLLGQAAGAAAASGGLSFKASGGHGSGWMQEASTNPDPGRSGPRKGGRGDEG